MSQWHIRFVYVQEINVRFRFIRTPVSANDQIADPWTVNNHGLIFFV